MDPARKRRIRLVVALTVALVLAGALAYTSFSASSSAVTPSELLEKSSAAQSYQLTGKVVDGSIRHVGDGIDFRVRDREGDGVGPGQLHGHRARPLQGRARGDRHRAPPGHDVRRREGLADDEVPVEVHRPEPASGAASS